ncbi:MAG: hypothetical protein IH626_19870 [Rhodospirillales bacterium]|nr:hypothetical protein [Rhodospirillales bacterium]
MEKEIQTVTRLADDIMAFVVAYGFQILGALVFLAIGLIAAGWVGSQVWVPSRKYFQVRCAVNGAALVALKTAQISLSPAGPLALTAPSLSSNQEACPS